MSPKKATKTAARRSSAVSKADKGFTAEEIAAMRETVKERKLAANKEEAEKAVIEKIAAMKGSDRIMAKRIHEIVKTSGPGLSPRTWYGMPAYADREGNIICFFQPADKFKARYATLGFNDRAKLDEGVMWPTAFALTELTPAEEARISTLVKKATS